MNWTTEGVYFNSLCLRGRSIQEVGLFARVRKLIMENMPTWTKVGSIMVALT